MTGTNTENEGNECLFFCLETRKKGGPFVSELDENRFTNADNDSLLPAAEKSLKAMLDPRRTSGALLEYTDAWGNPYVYIHHRDYGQKFSYTRSDGTRFEVEAAKSSTGGGHAAPSSFQLWSLGPDGENQNGGGTTFAPGNPDTKSQFESAAAVARVHRDRAPRRDLDHRDPR